jgi:hypothetical protein
LLSFSFRISFQMLIYQASREFSYLGLKNISLVDWHGLNGTETLVCVSVCVSDVDDVAAKASFLIRKVSVIIFKGEASSELQ